MRPIAGPTAVLAVLCALGLSPTMAWSEELPVVPIAWDSAALDGMVRAIGDYQRLVSAGGWQAVPDGPSMRPDMTDPRVPALRKRLAATGDMPASEAAATGDRVDPAVAAAVGRFQARHGLVVDGIAGRRTVETMNVSAADRANELMINYDRLRVLARTLPATGLVVNIPAATAQLMIDGRVALTSRVIVGQRGWPTPLLDGTIGEIELNPYWNVPTRIARLELLPKIAAQPGFLAANNMRVLGGPNGNGETPPASVDWSRFMQLGYRLRQDPGRDNPLGRIKFVFPNKYDVFLHDTPSRAAFARPDRALSHGCIRVERAFDLAVQLLAGDPAWSATSLQGAIDTGRTQQVKLARPMPIHTVYVSAWVAPDHTVQFRRDVYGQDAAEARRRASAAAAVKAACGTDASAPSDAGQG
jgi:murein L,D-transpeptidase YcbB/YkuD